MRKFLISVVLSALSVLPALAQEANTDSVKAQMDKIQITNEGMKQVIENYKKGVIKGDPESMTLLAHECLSGQYVKADTEMGLTLLESAANLNYATAQYDLGTTYFKVWVRQPSNDVYFAQGIKWFKKAIRGGNKDATIMMARFYYEYGKNRKEYSYVDGGIQMLESFPNVSEVNEKDEQVLNAQAWLGNMYLGKWRMESDTLALREAKKWYRTLLRSDLHFPNYTQYIDSMQVVLSMGVPLRIDPQPTAQEIEESQMTFSMGGFGGRPGRQPQAPQAPQGPQMPQPKYLGGIQAMQQFIRSNTLYPDNLKNQKINGRALITFTIDTDGAVINPIVAQHANANGVDIFIMDQEALRTIMIMPDWIPADQDGTPVQSQQSTTINFGGAGGGMGGFRF